MSESNTLQDTNVLYIVIPAYNEQETIRTVVEEWYSIVETHNGSGLSRLLIIDDGSKDNTYDILQKCAIDKPLLQIATKQNSGHGATVLHGYQMSLKAGADYIFQTDSDGQTSPAEFEQFWQLRQQNDMVIGWRKNREDGFSRIFVTKVLKAVIKLCFGVTVKDANTPFRLIKAITLQKYIDLIPPNYNLSNVILSVIFSKKKCDVTYIPITFRPRQGGVNSINFRRIIRIGWQALKDFAHIAKVIS